jgi:nitroreductase
VEFLELVTARYSARAYKAQPIEEKQLERVLNAARLAPTAASRQPFHLIVIHTHGREAELRRIYDKEWFVAAPLLICACAEPSQAWVRRRDGKNYADVDTTIAFDHLILAAANEGLGTCWVAAFDPDAARSILRLPANVEPLAFTPLGYSADAPAPKLRKKLADLVRYESW